MVVLVRLSRLPRLGTVNALTTYELRVSQSFPYNPAKRLSESASVVVFALVKPKRLFMRITEQMKRLNTNVRSTKAALRAGSRSFPVR